MFIEAPDPLNQCLTAVEEVIDPVPPVLFVPEVVSVLIKGKDISIEII